MRWGSMWALVAVLLGLTLGANIYSTVRLRFGSGATPASS